jgi:hypothetical protein
MSFTAGCDKDVDDSDDTDVGSDSGTEASNAFGVDINAFAAGAIDGDVTTVDCTLSNSVASTCYQFTLAGTPVEHDMGPFCPRNIADDASTGGIWLEDGEVYDVSGEWIENLSTFYNDSNWQLYDVSTGDINVTETQAACEAAARPNVAVEYQNHCVECDISYLEGEESSVVLIPVTPVRRSSPQQLDNRGKVGISLGGVTYDPPAPVDAILGAYTIAAFDDCGGHINPNVGYHYHSATGCAAEVDSADGHAPLIGYALDGYGMHAMLNDDGVEPDDLDECRGHEDTERGYHYHVAGPGENFFIGCFAGETGSVTE